MNSIEKNTNGLEKLRGIFFQIGLITATSIIFLAFEWTTPIYIAELPKPEIEVEGDFELPPVTYSSVLKKPEIQMPVLKVNPTQFNIVKTGPVNPTTDPVIPSEPDPIFDPNQWTTSTIEDPDPAPTPAPEVMPEFIGGDGKLFEYLSKNTKYPDQAKIAGIQGKVFVQFIVDKNGKVKDVKILQGINSLLNNEALRVVATMPDWKPGRQHGKPVPVIYNLPISFKLK